MRSTGISPAAGHRVMIWGALAVLSVVAPAAAAGRLGNAAGDLAPLAARRCRVFMGRGMVVPPTPEDFYMRPPATVRFDVGEHGTLAGPESQAVSFGCSALPVTAVSRYGYVFDRWSDGVTTNPRTLTNVTQDQLVAAIFRLAGAVEPRGEFLAVVDAANRTLWDLSGMYAASLQGRPMLLALVHDTKGKLTGSATWALGEAMEADLAVKGTAKGAAGELLVKLSARGGDADRASAVALAMSLVLDGSARLLAGPATGSTRTAGGAALVNERMELAVPVPMDGTWALRFDLAPGPKGITGKAWLTLASDVCHAYTVKGKAGADDSVILSFAADIADPAARGIKIKATITPLEGGWARIESFSGKGYGQTLAW